MTPPRNAPGRLIEALGFLYAAVTAIILTMSVIVPRPELRGILRTLFGLLLFPSLVLLPVMLLLRRWRVSLLLAPALIAWLSVYGTLLVPRGPAAPENGMTVRVLTFNLQTSSDNLEAITALIASADADIVALQELSEPAAEHLDTALAEQYPHRALYPRANAHQGQGMLSRFPIAEHEYWRNEHLAETLGHMWARLDIEGAAVIVFNAHPVPPISFGKGITLHAHSEEIDILLRRAAQHDSPRILTGDFNMTPLMDEYQLVTQTYEDTFWESGRSGFGFTFPAGNRLPLFPIIRLDYIFHSREFAGVDAYPLTRPTASDHRPFFAELVLLPSTGGL